MDGLEIRSIVNHKGSLNYVKLLVSCTIMFLAIAWAQVSRQARFIRMARFTFQLRIQVLGFWKV
ncbi:hypothetical protein Y017_07765 [Alcanivorax sp. 97CO-5]|nr:hypothetical protein Y017_07765 [Alcanivorax sp. 97CO-5]PKG02390.1 hypothetical protein Y019_03575 [Alcanivorax sp. 97CO-6]